jgi:hypothetical protein
MSPLTWAMKEVDPVRLHRQSGIHAQDLGIVKILRKKKIGRKMPPLTNGALCFIKPKHNGKSGTKYDRNLNTMLYMLQCHNAHDILLH